MGDYGIKDVIQISPRLTLTRFDLKKGVYWLEREGTFETETFLISARELRAVCRRLHLRG